MDRYFSLCRQAMLALLGSVFLVISCTDDMDNSPRTECIKFTSDIQNSWVSVIEGESDDIVRASVSTLRTDRYDMLYLHTLYTDSIESRFFTDSVPITRAAPRTGDNMYAAFGVSAYAYTGVWDGSQSPNYMYDVQVSKSGNLWSPSSSHYWPGAAYNMKFFAYAPKGVDAYRLSGQVPGAPTITCTVPDRVSDQQDLLVAVSGEINGSANSAINLTFRHVLTAVKFVCGSDMKAGTVKSVALKGVNSIGTYNFETSTWSDIGTPRDFSQTLDLSSTGTSGEAITTKVQTFMMIPQVLPDEAALEVVFEDSEGEHVLRSNVQGGEWPMGKTVTYKISTQSINWEYTLAVTGPDDFTHEGGTNTYSIASYRTNGSRTEEPVAWSAEFSTDGGTSWSTDKPGWLTAFTTNGSGGTTALSYNATVGPVSARTINPHTYALQRANAKGAAGSYYDLSTEGSSDITRRNTANCYVVDAPGWYCFPLVYGNAVKGGKDNKSAYVYGGTSTDYHVLKTFINHLGNPITDPYINNNEGCTAVKAELVWQDGPNLLTDIGYRGSGKDAYVTFYIGRSKIRQGNAVIAVKDHSGAVLWSWHIWVTDENIAQTQTVRNHASVVYRVMPVNLGWCDGDSTLYDERSCLVRIKTAVNSRIFNLHQSARTIARGNNPYYQWGRKDPFAPNDGYEATNKTLYDVSGTASTADPVTEEFFTDEEWNADKSIKYRASLANRCISLGIRKPGVMNRNQWGDRRYYNLWSMEDVDGNTTPNDDEVVKTIYDPCPVGFHLPPRNAFTGFTKTGATIYEERDSTKFNVRGTFDHGWNFYGNPDGSGDIIFVPATGLRNYDDGGVYFTLYELGESGFLHQAKSAGYGIFAYTYIGADFISYVGTLRKGRAIPVRGVYE